MISSIFNKNGRYMQSYAEVLTIFFWELGLKLRLCTLLTKIQTMSASSKIQNRYTVAVAVHYMILVLQEFTMYI